MEEHDKPPAPCDNSADIMQISWPVDGLPAEIFTTILLFVLSDLHFDRYKIPALQRLYRLRLVSLAWHRIVDSTPALWTFIDSSLPLNIVDIALEKSQASLLSIKCRPSLGTTDALFMEKVVPHIGRWGVANLCDTAWEYLPQAPAPQLRGSSITVYPRIARGSVPSVLRGEFTSLQSLVLHNVCFTGPLPDFGRSLRFLNIRRWGREDAGIPCTEVHRLLLRHSNLVEVKLQGFRSSEATPNLEMLEDVRLPSLRRFRLLGLKYNSLDCVSLVQKITAPNCTSFELAINDLPEGYSGLLQAVEPYFASVITSVSRDLPLSLSFTQGFTFAIGRRDKTFKLSGWNPKPDAELGWVVDLLVRYCPNVTDLEIVTPRALSDDGLSNLFVALPAVTQFRSEGGLEAAWNVLGKPAAPEVEGGPAQWLLPGLEKLSVLDQSDKEGERFIAMIQAREAAATDTDSTRSLAEHHPVRLKRAEYRGVAPLGSDRRLPELLGDRFVFESIEIPYLVRM